MQLLMAKAEVGVAVTEPETPMAQTLDLGMALAMAIPMIVLLRVLAVASPLLVELVRVLVVAVGKVMIKTPQVTE